MSPSDPSHFASRVIKGGVEQKFRFTPKSMPALILADLELVEGEIARLDAVDRLRPRQYDAACMMLVTPIWRFLWLNAEGHSIDKLRASGARITSSGDHFIIGFRELLTSSNFRLHGALKAWANAAREQLAKKGKTQ